MKNNLTLMVAGICVAIFTLETHAQTSVTTFGSLPQATFSGTGIPNDAVEITTITGLSSDGTIVLGLTATPRNTVGELANDGGGTFFANAGSQWNFDFYANVSGGDLSNYSFELLYGLAGTPPADLGVWNLNAGQPTSTTTLQDSEFPGFAFLSTGVAGAVTPPAGGFSFNQNAIQNYQFVLEAFDATDTEIGSAAISVDVVPEPSPMVLSSVGALALMGINRFRRKS